ncbi:methylthioribose-1-phosphate isomerase [Sporobacter termitidis DSM 10068]|uniref:Methylthioribose-1-phosphate isomerase n=1 Tax=Sporobacter termitidis DSM 10068 TaxID=1123282 RepID=A0A1M5Y752_9FIRM|nr:S-methyl-5-thioribose-1-phosphate isomerase [Sporobacter termitidis]SHI07802.1 methylthioribose-1-phosphate isomerase [Sporobacter termitidis DSM 10068]
MSLENVTHIDNVRLSDGGDAVVIIDQSLLPNETKYLTLSGREELFEAIHTLRVRGAPAIGVFAAYAACVLAGQTRETSYEAFYRRFSADKAYLDSSRPTAVNLRKALDYMDDIVRANAGRPVPKILEAMKSGALKLHQENMEMSQAISENGMELIKDGDGILTHCNAGPLGTFHYGTGLGTLFLARERGMTLHAYCDETRPLLQGARLTTYELQSAGIDCTLICDNMASIVMKEGKINAVFVGCDRVAANGDTANKIGTSGVAILARHYGIPFYVFCPSSTIDFSCETGDDIKIELRDPSEIKEKFFIKPMALPEVKCYNPAFDVTDHALITAIVTEKGICRESYTESLAMFKQPAHPPR